MVRFIRPAVLAAFLTCGVATAQPQKRPADRPDSKQQQVPKPTKPAIVVSNALGFIVQKGTEQGVTVVEEGRGWVIQDGEMKLNADQIKGPAHPIDPKLQINRIAAADDAVVVQVNVSPKDRSETFGRTIADSDRSKPPLLVDGKGRKYQAVGFIYKEPKIVHVRFTKAAAVTAWTDLPSVTQNNPDRELTLLFCVNLGMEVKEFRIGDKVLETYDPPIKCDRKQK